MLRGARTLVEARGYARSFSSRGRSSFLLDARLDAPPFFELRAPAPDQLYTDDSRAILRELKAVGGDLRSLRLALTGAATGPELAAVLSALARDDALARARRAIGEQSRVRSADAPLRHADALARRAPAATGPIRMYVCGSTVYQRIHVGNSRPFVLGMWLRSWLRATGYDVTLVHNITDVDDKVYAEAGKQGSRAGSFRSVRRRGSSRTRTTLGWDGPTSSRARRRRSRRSSAFIEELVEQGARVRRERRRLLRGRRLPGLRTAVRREARGDDRPGGERR